VIARRWQSQPTAGKIAAVAAIVPATSKKTKLIGTVSVAAVGRTIQYRDRPETPSDYGQSKLNPGLQAVGGETQENLRCLIPPDGHLIGTWFSPATSARTNAA